MDEQQIALTGKIEYEWCLNLKIQLKFLAKNHPHTVFTLDLRELDFIGSSSILHFVEVIKSLHREGLPIKLINVQTEFIKVFQLYQLFEVEISPPFTEKAEATQRSVLKKIRPQDPEPRA